MKINTLALVIAEPFVRRAYPGGVQGFLGDQIATLGEAQRLRLDGQLVVIVDPDPSRLVETYARIQTLTGQSIDQGAPCVLVDPLEGLMAPCDWVSCSSEEDGTVTLAYTGVEHGSVHDAVATCISDSTISDRGKLSAELTLLKLSEENGLTTWLDLETGRELRSASSPSSVVIADGDDTPRPLLEAVESMLARRGWVFERDTELRMVSMRLTLGTLLDLGLGFVASSEDVVTLVVHLPGCIRSSRMVHVMHYLLGVNLGLEVGGFDIDVSDGEVVYRASMIAPGGVMRPSTAEIALDRSVDTIRHYAAGLIEVNEGADPQSVLERIEAE